MYAQVNIKYKQDIAKEEVPLFRSATQEKLDEVISKYKQNVIETIEDEFEGKDVEVEVVLVDDEI